MINQKKTVLMAVGSSGGHIYPALAVAEQLEEILSDKKKRGFNLYQPGSNFPASHSQSGENIKNSKNKFLDQLSSHKKLKEGINRHLLNIHFAHSGSPLGKKLLAHLKYPAHTIPVGGLAKGQSLLQKIKTLFQIPQAFILSFLLIKRLKPEVIIGTGGAVSGPVLLIGSLMGKKTAIWEGNSSPGLANRWLAPFVSCIFTVFHQIKGLPQKKQIVCGYPLRKQSAVAKTGKNSNTSASPRLGQKTDKISDSQESFFKILVLGGSQGSFLINQAVCDLVQEEAWRQDIFIYHQTGEKSFDLIQTKYQSLKGVKAFAFSLNIEEYYKECDLIVSRAGSGAIWETASYGKALLLIPLSASAEGHQLKNALELSKKNSAEVIQERDFNSPILKQKLIELKEDRNKRELLANSLKSLALPGGAKQIAEWVLS